MSAREQSKRAQLNFDHLLPEPEDLPGPENAMPCVCGFAYPWFEVFEPKIWGQKEIRVVCKCGREGPFSLWRSDAVEAWNGLIKKLRKEEL